MAAKYLEGLVTVLVMTKLRNNLDSVTEGKRGVYLNLNKPLKVILEKSSAVPFNINAIIVRITPNLLANLGNHYCGLGWAQVGPILLFVCFLE